MEEKKEVVEDKKEKATISEEEYLKLKRSNEKKKATIVILVFAMILIIAVTILFYLVLNKKEPIDNKVDNVESSKILSNDEAIAIAKQKLDEANNLFNGFSCEGNSDSYEFLCYYSDLDTFKNKFYSIYAKDLVFKDVFLDYVDYPKEASSEEDYGKQEAYGHETSYFIQDNKVYVNRECRGTGSEGVELTNYKVTSLDDNKIEISYDGKTRWSDNDENISAASIILVKENNKWRIQKATIIDACDFTKEVGK